MNFLLKLLAYAAGIAVAAWALEGIYFVGSSDGLVEMEEKVLPLLGVSLILTVVNMIIRPVAKTISLPLIVITLGLFMLVINAVMLLLTAEIAENVGLDFQVETLLAALLGSVVITIVTMSLDLALGDK